MNFKILLGLSLCNIIACDANIGIATEKETYDTYDTLQEPSEDNGSIQEETGITEQETEENLLPDFSVYGPHYPYGITLETHSINVTNCANMQYDVYTPYADNPPMVVLGHGFARGPDVMAGWAEHLSSWGVKVLLPTLCHYNVFTGVDHEMNGQNMVELASFYNATEVVYAGHSAGGLAAIIAASLDDNAIGVLGLDATDTQDIPGVPDLIGQNYASNITCPAFSIFGEPSTCNAVNNGLNLFSMMNSYQAIKIIDADHCDFENPTDWICKSQCENTQTTFSEEEIQKAVVVLGTAAIISLTELSNDGILIWTEDPYSWENSGLIQKLE
tara:strand:- start:2290 stop:3279 length:990 start_codon:yes stop_codon:yes gene_type:complete